MKAIVRKSGKRTLKEIEKATKEKLSNKILKSFFTELIYMLPAILLIMLEMRQASSDSCNLRLLKWLLWYFGTMVGFCFVRLARIPILHYTHFYFIYTISVSIFYYLGLFSIFIWGNIVFWQNIRSPECETGKIHIESAYDARILWSIVGITLALNWVAIIVFV